MHISKSVTIVALLAFSLAIIYFFWGLRASYIIVKVEAQSFQCKLDADSFYLNWIHSVEKTSWQEQYVPVSNGFVLTESSLVSFGAGTPENAQVLKQENGQVTFKIDQFLPEINWVVSRRTRGSIKVGEVEWQIFQQFPDYSVINISTHKDSIWKKRGLNDCL